ncbi:DUF6380 family protein [Streptomyces bungoensis]|uniref:DUF6380 family protein n=1 Tax=Streptomyces bungoensis TaxID=285568 RepID=UPI003435950C
MESPERSGPERAGRHRRTRRATLRTGVASLTATAGRAPFIQHARHARKDAR